MSRNRLHHEQSPYLRQHADNPVDWRPWGEAAFGDARERDVPIFLSIGYATCHWCHVMAHESFEDEEVAELLNRGFVPVKVDREERPDVDAVYMTVCQMLNGHGGWPLTVVLTPDLEPFFAGTYFPRDSRGGRIGMLELLPRLGALWRERRADVHESAASITGALRAATEAEEPGVPGREEIEAARRMLGARFDPVHGGFGGAPKFPSPHVLGFLLREWERAGDDEAREMAVRTLHAMRRGGIHDQVGGGFHRYATDAEWRLPHFEKMLYDQALLAMAYIEGWEATGEPAFEATARRTLDYVVSELADPAGGFQSAEDADSEGEEGKYYVWTEREIADALECEADIDFAVAAFGLEPQGNFRDEATGRRSGANVLLLSDAGEAEPDRLRRIRALLAASRADRVRPARDDKVLADWNGLAIAALARAARALGEERYARAARRAAGFVEERMRDGDGRLLHRWRAGEAAIPAFADDHAFLAWGLLELYEATFEVEWLRRAVAALEELLGRFADADGALRQAAEDADAPLVRIRESSDGALPSANSVAAGSLFRAARLTGRVDLEDAAHGILRALGGRIAAAPAGHAAMLQAVQFAVGPTAELVIAGGAEDPATAALLAAARRGFRPRLVAAWKDTSDAASSAALEETAPFTGPLGERGGRPAAWLCRDHSCDRPRTDPAALEAALDEV